MAFERALASADHPAGRRSGANAVWSFLPYLYGYHGCMKKTLHIDEKTLGEAKLACGATTDTETVRLGLEALIRHAANQRLRRLRGSETGAADVPRRRDEAGKKKRVG
jgi:Arc/MetJ family transcription regulator